MTCSFISYNTLSFLVAYLFIFEHFINFASSILMVSKIVSVYLVSSNWALDMVLASTRYFIDLQINTIFLKAYQYPCQTIRSSFSVGAYNSSFSIKDHILFCQIVCYSFSIRVFSDWCSQFTCVCLQKCSHCNFQLEYILF